MAPLDGIRRALVALCLIAGVPAAGVAMSTGTSGAATASAVTNGSFETGAFTGWTITTAGSGTCSWRVLKATTTKVCVATRSGPSGLSAADGQYFANVSWDGEAGTHPELSQVVTVPSAAPYLSWFDATSWNLTYSPRTTPTTAIQDRVEYVDVLSGKTVEQSFTVQTLKATTSASTGWIARSVDLSAYAGQTVGIRFRLTVPQSFTGPAGYLLDGVAFDSTATTTTSITNGSFETGTFDGWTTTSATTRGTRTRTCQWRVYLSPSSTWCYAGGTFQTPSTSSASYKFPTRISAVDGSYFAAVGWDGRAGSQSDLSQVVTVPTGTTARLTWYDYTVWDLAYTPMKTTTLTTTTLTITPITVGPLTSQRSGVQPALATIQDRVEYLDVLTALGTTVLHSFTIQTLVGRTAGATTWVSRSVDLSAYAGQTVTIRFRLTVPQTKTGPASYAIDDIAFGTTGLSCGYYYGKTLHLYTNAAQSNEAIVTAGKSVNFLVDCTLTVAQTISKVKIQGGLSASGTPSYAWVSDDTGGKHTLSDNKHGNVATSTVTRLRPGTYHLEISITNALWKKAVGSGTPLTGLWTLSYQDANGTSQKSPGANTPLTVDVVARR